MMSYIGIAIGIVAYIAVLIGGAYLLFDDIDIPLRVLGGAMLFAGMVFTIWGIDQLMKNSPPCLEYETRLMYNAATKTMMPAQFCVNEGVWK